MDDTTDSKPARKPPGAPFFMVAMGFYLLLVHGTSLLWAGAGSLEPQRFDYPGTGSFLRYLLGFLESGTVLTCALMAIVLLYGCMLCVFILTRHLVGGPVWLGSLAGTFLMAHPVKTEVLFSPTGIYYGLAAFFALAATLAYVRARQLGGFGRHAIALILYAGAVIPFTVNAAFFGVIIALEFLVGDADKRNWLRPLPLIAVTMLANWFHLDTLYAVMPTPPAMWTPLILVLYPIGFLPETVEHLVPNPLELWLWGAVSGIGVILLLVFVKSRPFRLAVLSVLLFRFYHGALPIDFVSADGGGQLLYSVGLTGVAFAAFSAWLMGFEAWGRPTVALTSIICAVLFILQFQANREYLRRAGETPTAEQTVELTSGRSGAIRTSASAPCAGRMPSCVA
jgi:hypothetical protein